LGAKGGTEDGWGCIWIRKTVFLRILSQFVHSAKGAVISAIFVLTATKSPQNVLKSTADGKNAHLLLKTVA